MALVSPASRLSGRRPSAGAAPFRQAPLPPSHRLVKPAAQKQTFSSFEDMLSRSETPLLVDFYATWCGPCQMVAPTLSAVASKLKGKVQVVKIDTDKYPAIASAHNVHALPTIALFVNGKVVFRFEGVLSEGQLLDRINYHLTAAAKQ